VTDRHIGPTFVDQLAAASVEAREVLAELRFEVAEAKRQRKALGNAINAAKEAVSKVVQEDISAECSRQLGELNTETRKAIDQATAKIMREFDGLYNTLMTGNKQGRSKDGLDLRTAIGRHVKGENPFSP
jgi:hypothetical protein